MKWVHDIVKKTQAIYTQEFQKQRAESCISGYSPLITTLLLMCISCFLLWDKDEDIFYFNAGMIAMFGGLYSIYSIGGMFIHHNNQMHKIHLNTLKHLPQTTGLEKKWVDLKLSGKKWTEILPVILTLIIKHDMTANTFLEHEKCIQHRKLSSAKGHKIFSSPFALKLATNKKRLMSKLNLRIITELDRLISIHQALNKDHNLTKSDQQQLKKLTRLNSKPTKTQQWLESIYLQYKSDVDENIKTHSPDELLIEYAQSDLKIIHKRLTTNHQTIADDHCQILNFIRSTAIEMSIQIRQSQ